MSNKSVSVLFLGDIVGQPGMRAVVSSLATLVKQYRAALVVVNAENANEGYGLLPEQAMQLFGAGAQVITTGNHVWRQSELLELLDSDQRLLRPANYPPGLPGHGSCVVTVRGARIAVVNLQGRERLPTIDCPFRKMRELIRGLSQESDAILVDFHAESPAEKEALSYWLDGDVGAIIGTHTHVQTSDERLLPGGTAYITDVGACCVVDSVIGFDPVVSVERATSQLPLKVGVAEGRATICGALVELDRENGMAHSIERIRIQSAL